MHKILFLCFLNLCVFIVKSAFEIFIENELVFIEREQTAFFDYNGQNTFSCRVPDVYRAKPTENKTTFIIKNKDPSNSYKIYPKTLNVDKNVANPIFLGDFPIDIFAQSSMTLSLNYNCENFKKNSHLFYTIIDLEIDVLNSKTLKKIEKMEFSYVKICRDEDNMNYKFDYSLIIVAVSVALFLIAAMKISKIMSIKKKTVTININFLKTFIYFFSLIPLLLLYNYHNEGFLIVYQVIITIVAFLSFVFFSDQLLSNLFMRSDFYIIVFKIPKLNFQLTLFMIFGIMVSFVIMIPWLLTNNWILSDIITLIIFISVVNTVKLNKFKNCLFLMTIQILADLLWMVLFNNVFNENYNDFFGSKLTIPMKIECFYINPQFNLNSKCSWIGISNLIIPTLFISFFNRFDNYMNATIYSIASFIGFYLGLIIWIAVQSKITSSIPLSIYCYPIMCIFCALLAFKRNENYEIWNGLFPDRGLEEPIMKSQDLLVQSKDNTIWEKEKDEKSLSFPDLKSVSLSAET